MLAENFLRASLHQRAEFLARMRDEAFRIFADYKIALRVGELRRACELFFEHPDFVVARFDRSFELLQPCEHRLVAAVAKAEGRECDDQKPREHSGKTVLAAFDLPRHI